LELILELFLEIAAEAFFALGWDSIAHSMRRRHNTNPLFASLGCIIMGLIAGSLSLIILPRRLVPEGGVRGLNVLITPVATGLIMKTYGDYRRRRGLPTTFLATFWGGAIFALSMAAVRFWVTGIPPDSRTAGS